MNNYTFRKKEYRFRQRIKTYIANILVASITLQFLVFPAKASSSAYLEISDGRFWVKQCDTNASTIVVEAMKHLGEGYKSGKEGNGYYDCIGLVRKAYAEIGIDLVRAGTGNGTRTWAEQGLVLDVSEEELYPGDIICWYKNTNTKSGQPDHVAIYTGYIKLTDGSSYKGYNTDSEGYLVDTYKRRVNCINALNSTRGVCLINYEKGSGLGNPTDFWRAPTVLKCNHNDDYYSRGHCTLEGCGAWLPFNDYSYNPDGSVFIPGNYRVKDGHTAYLRDYPYQVADSLPGLTTTSYLINVIGCVKNGLGNIWYRIAGRDQDYYCYADHLEFVSAVESTLSISNSVYPTGNIAQGKPFDLSGMISSNFTITNVCARVYDDCKIWLSYSRDWNQNSYSIASDGLDKAMPFKTLEAGLYIYEVSATDASGVTKQLIYSSFSVGGSSPQTQPVAPAAPRVSVSGSSVTVSWDDVANETSYDVYLVQEPWGWGDIKYVKSVPANTCSVVFDSINDGYYLAFVISRPNDNAVQSPWSEVYVSASAATVYLNLDGRLDDRLSDYIAGYGTVDVYINGALVADDWTDYWASWPVGTSYWITDVKPNPGYSYNGVVSGSAVGTVGDTRTDVVLDFNWIDTSNIPPATDQAVFNGNVYLFYNLPVTWYTANAYCEALGGHLVAITSAEENQFVWDFCRNSFTWIGGNDVSYEGYWQWVTGESFSYTNWHPVQPDNAQGGDEGGEDYLHLFYDGLWNDNQGYVKYPFICEIEKLFVPTPATEESNQEPDNLCQAHTYTSAGGDYCTVCGYKYEPDLVPYNRYMFTVNDITAVRIAPYAKSGAEVINSLQKGDYVHVTHYLYNSLGNMWYLTEDGYYIYSERLSETPTVKYTIRFLLHEAGDKLFDEYQATKGGFRIPKTLIPTRDGYVFEGWALTPDSVPYQPGQSLTVTGDMTFYAVWTEKKGYAKVIEGFLKDIINKQSLVINIGDGGEKLWRLYNELFSQKMNENQGWCAAFVSVVMKEASGLEWAKPSASPDYQRDELKRAGCYYEKSSGYTPKTGDLAFWFKYDEKIGKVRNHVGFVVVDNGEIYILHGNFGSKVSYTKLKGNLWVTKNSWYLDECLTGYGDMAAFAAKQGQ